MKTIKAHLKAVALIWSILIFFQGCTVYKSSVSLEEASRIDSRVKVYTTTNESYKFERIGVDEGKYYGVKKSNGEIVNIPLERNELYKVLLKDNTRSIISTVSVVLGSVYAGMLLAFWIGQGASFD